jgi:hypothetical protein
MGILNDINAFLNGAKIGRNQVSSITGQMAHYVVELSGANVTIPAAWRGCRWVECDVAGTVRVAYTKDNGVIAIETKALSVGEKWLVPDVQTVYYQYGTTPASCDTKALTDAGDEVTGIKLKY